MDHICHVLSLTRVPVDECVSGPRQAVRGHSHAALCTGADGHPLRPHVVLPPDQPVQQEWNVAVLQRGGVLLDPNQFQTGILSQWLHICICDTAACLTHHEHTGL